MPAASKETPAQKNPTQKNPTQRNPTIKVRKSKVHGSGVFALRPIRKGARIIEYVGERISHAAADARYEDRDENDNHTFLFIVNKRTVIDAGVAAVRRPSALASTT